MAQDDTVDFSQFTEDERLKLIEVMKKAEEFQVTEEKKMLTLLEGQLRKFTNVMKGWQYRWFTLDPDTGMLEYFEREEHKKQRPRGYVHLAAATVCPSDEDSQTFAVNAASGEVYRLKANDAKARQHWINRLRAIAEYHTNNLVQKLPSPPNDINNQVSSYSTLSMDDQKQSHHRVSQDSTTSTKTPVKITARSHHKSYASNSMSRSDPLRNVKDIISHVSDHEEHLLDKLENLPSSGHYINGLDKDILLLKATSRATIACLEECVAALHQQTHTSTPTSLPSSGKIERRSLKPRKHDSRSSSDTLVNILTLDRVSGSSIGSTGECARECATVIPINHDEETEDPEGYHDTDLGGVEEHKSVILHLLSQLKLGMDLTRVVLPTFILEKRSLLEMFADCMAHPCDFLKIPDLETPEQRMLQIVEWYLTSFHAGRQGSVAKKPYNPIIGETFHCSWKVPNINQTSEGHRTSNSTFYVSDFDSTTTSSATDSDNYLLTYLAEQVSHHPPVSAFYFECPQKKISLNASIWTKSKFYGMSIGVVMVGKLAVHLGDHGETYELSLPSAYARSILTYPWVELGDKISISCSETGYSAAVTFHTKPFYGGKLHRVTAEVKNPENNIICKVNGEWNSYFDFQYANGDNKTVKVANLDIMRKGVRPINNQADFESRKLWQHVTNALMVGDVETATEHKKILEDRQREGERHRKDTGTSFPTKFFKKEGDTWVYKNCLKLEQKTAVIYSD